LPKETFPSALPFLFDARIDLNYILARRIAAHGNEMQGAEDVCRLVHAGKSIAFPV
jgi:hypothetical protein